MTRSPLRRRVPVRYQLTGAESAAACLAMVLSYHRRHTSVSQCRAPLGADPNGASLSALSAAADTVGLLGHRGEWTDTAAAPMIARLTGGRFVVVERVGRRWTRLVDPATGRRRLSRADLDAELTEPPLRLAPTAGFRRRRPALRDAAMVRYLRQLSAAPGGKRLLGVAAALAGVLQILALATPLLTKAMVDSIIPAGRTGLLTVCLAGAVVIALVCGVLSLARGLALLTLRLRGDRLLSRGLVDHLMHLPLRYFLDRGRGDLLLRLSSVSSTREALTQQLLTTALDGFLLLGYLIGLFLLSPLYTVALLPLFALELGLLTGTYRRMRLLAQRELSAKSAEQSYLVEALAAIMPLKANGAEDRAVEHWYRLFTAYQKAVASRGRASAWLSGAQRALVALGPLLLLCAGAWLALTHRMTLGTMLAANSAALAVLAPLAGFAGSGQAYQAVRAQLERIFDITDTPVETSGRVRLPADQPCAITVRQVGFRYLSGQAPVLAGISFEVGAGQKLGIVGRTGSGKSTLGLILLGLLQAEQGELSYNGVRSSDVDIAELRSGCGAVLQDLTLFNGTIRDNLLLGRIDADDADIVRAATAAGLHEDVLALPLGYQTPVGDGGNALSAGQRQRIALARALIHRPRVLVLDEATSHLDPHTERRVDDALSRLRVTRIVISHRVSAIRNADQILVLDGGRIVQRGRHDELVGTDGCYRTLFGPDREDVPAAAVVR